MMALPDSPGLSNEPDELDALFQDPILDDIFKQQEKAGKQTNYRLSEERDIIRQDDAGAEEEIKITKKRAPRAKLDDAKLLSPAGIPKLRKIAKKNLKFRGKGHEFSDVAMLLRTYQFWLDDLFPRAKFADGLSIIEKVGHTKRMQLARKEWIDESRFKTPAEDHTPMGTSASVAAEADPPVVGEVQDPGRSFAEGDLGRMEHGLGRASVPPSASVPNQPDEDELDALMAEESFGNITTKESLFGPSNADQPGRSPPAPEDYDYEDEHAIMREMEIGSGS